MGLVVGEVTILERHSRTGLLRGDGELLHVGLVPDAAGGRESGASAPLSPTAPYPGFNLTSLAEKVCNYEEFLARGISRVMIPLGESFLRWGRYGARSFPSE